MPLNVKAGGSWRTASKVYAKVAGVWVTAKELWGYMNGGWRSAWKNEVTYINTANRTGASIHQLMGSPTQPGTYTFINQASITAGTGSFALRTGTFPAGSVLKIINQGYIRGRGGAGGDGAAGVGGAGGTALYIDFPCTVDNSAGYIFGGGGGGGGAYYYNNQADGVRAGGGGGAGSSGGAAGASAAAWKGGSDKAITRQATAGTETSGGVGAIGSFVPSISKGYAYGGSGGGPGTAGASGSITYGNSTNLPVGYGAGGAAGAAILKNGNTVTVTAGNNTSQIKGAIV